MIENKLRSLLNPLGNENLDQLPIYWEAIKAHDFHFLALICCDSELLQQTLQDYITHELNTRKVPFHYYSQEEFLKIFENESFNSSELICVCLENPSDNWYLNLNIHRDLLIRQKQQVLFFCPPPIWESFSSKAPDFYSRLSLDFYFHDISVYDGESAQPDFSDIERQIKDLQNEFEELKESNYPSEIKILNMLEFAEQANQLDAYHLCLTVAKYALSIINPKKDKLLYALALRCRGFAHRGMGHLQQALQYHQQEGKLMDELKNNNGIIASYISQANLLRDLGRLNEALLLFKKQEKLSLKLGDVTNIISTYNNQGLVLLNLGRLAEAFSILSKAESAWENSGDKRGLSYVYANKGLILKTWGKLEEAMIYHKKDESICLEIGDRQGLAISYGNQADILLIWSRYEQSLNLFRKKEKICIEIGNLNDLADCYINMVPLFASMGKLEEAIHCNEKALKILQKSGNRSGMIIILGHKIAFLIKQKKDQEALDVAKEHEKLCLETNNKKELAQNYYNQGILQDYDNALIMYSKAEQLAKELKYDNLLSVIYNAFGAIYLENNKLEDAHKYLKLSENLLENAGNKGSLITLYQNQAVLLKKLNRYDEAKEILQKANRIAHELNLYENIVEIEKLLSEIEIKQ